MAQCSGFTAAQYDPEAWAKLFQKSGARYAVLTAKHHDGIASWDTQHGVERQGNTRTAQLRDTCRESVFHGASFLPSTRLAVHEKQKVLFDRLAAGPHESS